MNLFFANGITDHTWANEDGKTGLVRKHREDLIFASGYDRDAQNTSRVVNYEYTDPKTGDTITPSDHAAVVDTINFQFPDKSGKSQSMHLISSSTLTHSLSGKLLDFLGKTMANTSNNSQSA